MANDLKHPIKRVADVCDFIREQRKDWAENQSLAPEFLAQLNNQLGATRPIQESLPDLYLLVESLISRAAEEDLVTARVNLARAEFDLRETCKHPTLGPVVDESASGLGLFRRCKTCSARVQLESDQS